jgi:hypothetical protein
MLIDEVAELLKITPKQIRRPEQRGAFPIPRLPKLDRHPRYARGLVERFASNETPALVDASWPHRLNAVASPSGAASAFSSRSLELGGAQWMGP